MKSGEIIKAARLAKRMSQAKLGALVGVSTQAVSQWEKGQTRPNIFSAKRLAIELELERDWLLNDDAVEAIGGKLPKSRYASEYKGLIPLIDINETAYFSRNLNFSKAKIPKAQRLLRPTFTIFGYCFAIAVKDSRNESTYKIGDIIIISVDIFPSDNDFVVSQIQGAPPDRPIIGRFVFNGDDPFAWIYNDAGEDARFESTGVVGTVIEHRRFRGRADDPYGQDLDEIVDWTLQGDAT